MAGNLLSSPNLNCKCNKDGNQSNQITDKVFCCVSANLNIYLFTKHERQEICNLFTNIKITKVTSENGIETVNGSYKDIERMYSCFGDLQQRKEKSKTVSIGNAGFDHQVNRRFMLVDSAKYEYFDHAFYQETDELKQRYGVRIDCVDSFDGGHLFFVALHENSHVEKAQETFVAIFQKAFGDWFQEIISVPHKSQLDQMVQMINENYKRVLPKKNNNSLILRGPKQEIMEAKQFLEQVKTKLVPKTVNISIASRARKNGVEVDSKHFELAREFVFKDIKEIEKKYAVLVEIKSLQAEKFNVIFTPKDPNLDYSVHAYEHFICSFQKIVTNVSRTAICLKSFDQDVKLLKLTDDLKKELHSLSFQTLDKTLIVTGLLHHVMTAKEQLHNLLDKEDMLHSRNASKSSSGQGHNSSSRTIDHHFPDKKCFQSKSPGLKEEDDACPICLEIPKKKICLEKCNHEFCEECLNIAMSHKPVCPVCNMAYGIVKGDQPEGTMALSLLSDRLPGYSCGTIVIEYSIPDGIQGAKHPNPGRKFQGTHRRAYLPDNADGRQVLSLLKKAFDQKLIFTVGHSRTSGANDAVTWNDIHHKTNMHGGPERYGYPDPEYLHRVRDELKAKGIQ